MTRIISKFLAMIMMINIISINNPNLTFANEVNKDEISLVKLSTYKEGNINKSPVDLGQKGIDYNINSLHIEHDKDFKIDKNRFDIYKLDKDIRIMINGNTQDHVDDENKKLKFDFKYDEKTKAIKIEIKEGESDNTHKKPFILRKHSLYNIVIPAGFFIDDSGKKSDKINYTFTTKGDGPYGKDIIKDISPSNKVTEIDYKNNKITVDFIDDIFLSAQVKNNIDKYFKLTSSSITSPEVGNFDSIKQEDINKFKIYVGKEESDAASGKNKHMLTFESKNTKLNDFATYNLSILSDTIQLINSKSNIDKTTIYNDTHNITFSTDNWIKSVNLNTNDGDNGWIPYDLPLGNIEDVPVNPLIQIKFKYRVELRDRTKIRFSSDAHDFSIDVNKDSWINYDGDTLKLDINSLQRSGKNPLRKNTAYKITIDKGALKLKDYNYSGTNRQLENEEMNIYFITGNWTTNASSGLYVTKYTSDKSITHDNIVNLNNSISSEKTDLDKDGEIYIHFNRNIKWNASSNPAVTTDEQALKYFKIYKLPSAYERGYDKKGVVFDKQFRFNKYQNIYTKNGITEDEVPIESVTLDRNDNKIKIEPKYGFLNLNQYRIVLLDKNIITDDNYEKKLSKDINQTIWTKKSESTKKPNWVLSDEIKAEEIIGNTNSPYKTYRLHGVPEYNEYIDKDNGKPIVIYLDTELIPNPEKINPLSGIYLSEGYKYADKEPIRKEIEWYKIEYLGEGKDKKTKVSIYPKGTLDSGKFYRFKIPNNTFVTRSGHSPEFGAEFEFVIRGDKTDNAGIYTLNLINKQLPVLINDFSNSNPIRISIKGYNFNEDVKSITFERKRDGHKIKLGSENIKFKSVTELEAEIKGDAALQFAKVGSGGVYSIYIEFGNGNKAQSIDSNEESDKLVVHEKPYVIDTLPNKDDWDLDKESLYQSFPNGSSGNYLTVVFDNIGGLLKIGEGINSSNFEFYSKDAPGSSLVDSERSIEYEGFCDSDELMKRTIQVSGEKRSIIESPYGTSKLYINDDKYKVGDEIEITLFDHEIKSDKATASISIGKSDAKDVTLTRDSRNSGKFTGKIKIWSSSSTGEDSNLIEVKYLKRQSGDGMINKEAIQTARVVNRVDYRRKAQVYIEKDIYKNDEEVKITVIDKGANERSESTGTIGKITVDAVFPDDDNKKKTLTLVETGMNTGIFEGKDALDKLEGKFNIIYTYAEKELSNCKSGKVKVYIPITNAIEDDTIYIAKLPKVLVYYGFDEEDKTNKWGNDSYEWSFKTSDGPIDFNIDRNFKGSAPENYDDKYKIILKGENFSKDVKVYFKDITGEKHEAIVSKTESSDKLLHVFLPTGSNRLKTGLYDILVEIEGGTSQEIKYGVFSIVPKGAYVPNEEDRVKDAVIDKDKDQEKIVGGLKEVIKTSKNQLELTSKYTSQTLNLDNILGEEVLVREIKYNGSSISILDTKSKWADIKLTGLSRGNSNQAMIIRLGRAEQTVRDTVNKKLTGDSVKSDFIQILGTNYELDSAQLSIPYRESKGDKLKVLRYDEDTRRIDKNVSFRVNKNDKRIEITNAKKGIFVVVE